MQMTKRFIYPPRPKTAVQRHLLEPFAAAGWKAQIKYNDDRIVLSCDDSGVEMYNRHGELRVKSTLPTNVQDQVFQVLDMLNLDRSAWNYLDGGLLHSKGKIWNNTIVLWDLLVANGTWLLGTTYAERYNRLVEASGRVPFKMIVKQTEFTLGYKLTENIFIPITYDNPEDVWNIVDQMNRSVGWAGSGEPTLEGCVMKNYNGTLELATKEANNDSWMARSRVVTGRHRY